MRQDKEEGLTNLAELVKYAVKVDQDLPFGHFCYVVHGLTSVVPDPGILIGEAR